MENTSEKSMKPKASSFVKFDKIDKLLAKFITTDHY